MMLTVAVFALFIIVHVVVVSIASFFISLFAGGAVVDVAHPPEDGPAIATLLYFVLFMFSAPSRDRTPQT